MAEFIEKFKALPTWMIILIAIGIGVLVLIPIVIITAAIIGTFVLSMGNGAVAPEPPQVNLAFDHNETTNELTVSHMGTDSFPADSVFIETETRTTPWAENGTAHAGDTVTIENISTGDTIEVVWTGDQDNRTVLETYTAE